MLHPTNLLCVALGLSGCCTFSYIDEPQIVNELFYSSAVFLGTDINGKRAINISVSVGIYAMRQNLGCSQWITELVFTFITSFCVRNVIRE